IILFYLAAPLLIRTADQAAWSVVPAIGVFAALIAVHLWLHPIDVRLLLYWPIFVVAILYQRQPRLRGWLEQRRLLLLLLVVPAVFVCRGANEWSLIGIARAFPIALIGSLVCFIYAPIIARPLHARTVTFFAYTGFGLYLFHRVVFKAAIALYFPAKGWDQVLYLLLVVLPVTILIAYLIQTGYDRGLDAWQQRRATGQA
ncbi:MAG: acyltransferase, partial [Thiohalocapsa sp.]